MRTARLRTKPWQECEAEQALTNGQWVGGLVKRWQPNPVELKPERRVNPHDLIACPKCLARMDERCKRADGTPRRGSHESRLVKRVCACGEPVRHVEPMCGFCRAEIALEEAA